MSFNSVGTLIVIVFSLVIFTNAHPVERTFSGPATVRVPLTPTVTDGKNSSEEVNMVSGRTGFRQVFWSAFLPGGLGDAIAQPKESSQLENLVDAVQSLKDDVAQIHLMLRERQEQDNYREHVAKEKRQEDRDKDGVDFFDVVEFIVLVCVFYILLKVVVWMCAHTTKPKATAVVTSTTDSNTDPLLGPAQGPMNIHLPPAYAAEEKPPTHPSDV